MIPSEQPPKAGICILPILQMRKLRPGEGYTLLKVTRHVSTRVKMQNQARVNPDAKSFPSARPRNPALKGPVGGQRVTEITT